MESFLLVSDLHLTDDPWDEYRWGLFPWIEVQQQEYNLDTLFILGDLTDKKDNHSAILTNRIVQAVDRMSRIFAHVVILMGNHDYLLRDHPFFQFLEHMANNVIYAAHPRTLGPEVLLLPYAKDPSAYWTDFNLSDYKLVFLHQTVSGALASNGTKMEGVKIPLARGTKIWSGDIHVPQMVGNVEYVGSPYPVHFGDRFQPRCVLCLDDGKYYDVTYPTISKFSTSVRSGAELHSLELSPGDQLKLKVVLPREDLGRWNEIRQDVLDEAAKMGIAVRGIELVVDRPPVARVKLPKRGVKGTCKMFGGDCDCKEGEGFQCKALLARSAALNVSATSDVLNKFATLEQLGEELVEEGTSIIHENN